MSKKLLLIDGHSILNRTFYGIPELTNSEGLHTNAVYGFLNILFKILEEENADYCIVAFDVKQPTFRHEMYREYKGTRKPMPKELHEQVPLMKEVLASMNIKTIEAPGYEADDIIGTLSKRGEGMGMEVSVLSGDRDLLQLATEHIMIRIPKTKKGNTEIENYNAEGVKELYGVTPLQFIDVKAFMGDTADNIPGVPGVGEKTAIKLISEYGSLDGVYDNIDNIKKSKMKENVIANEELARLSKTLATINIQAPVECNIEEATVDNIYNEQSFEFMKRLEFKSIIKKFDSTDIKGNYEINSVFVDNESEFIEMLDNINDKPFGIEVCNVGDMLAVSICSDKEIAYCYIGSGFMVKGITGNLLANSKNIALFDLKSILKAVQFNEGSDNLNISDLFVQAYLLNPLKDNYDYDDIARDYIGITVQSREELLGKRDILSAYEEDRNSLVKMLNYKSNIAFCGKEKVQDELDKTHMHNVYSDIELPLIYALDRMEKNGVKVQKEALESYSKELEHMIEEVENRIYDAVGEKFKINSPKQLGEILFVKLGLPGAKKTKTGYSTSADILDKLKDDYPVVADILLYRQLTKLNSTYAVGLVQYIEDDGRIHGKFNQTITATGRISSTEPNLQNIPIRMEKGKEIRKVFVPEDGNILIDADYSQIELRILADMSGDENLIEAYNEACDIHRITASKVFHVPLDEVTKTQRSNAKAVNFGIVYGISSFGLSQDLSISRKEAEQYIKEYFESYPGIHKCLEKFVADAKEKGYTVTAFGRRRPVPELKSSNFMQRSFGERIAMNSPIQGTAADIMKIAMINVDRRLRDEGKKSKIVLQVHDELLIEAPVDEKDEIINILKEEMSGAAHMRVALEVDVQCGNNWLEAH